MGSEMYQVFKQNNKRVKYCVAQAQQHLHSVCINCYRPTTNGLITKRIIKQKITSANRARSK